MWNIAATTFARRSSVVIETALNKLRCKAVRIGLNGIVNRLNNAMKSAFVTCER